MADGILEGPIDLDRSRRATPAHPTVPAQRGLVVEHRASGIVGSIVSFADVRVVLRDRDGRSLGVRPGPGAFMIDGRIVTLVAASAAPRSATITASGSVAVAHDARVARASRILVEGIHDAELVEKVWGDDLREVGVVVERLDGMDDLAAIVRDFAPGPTRRLGVLLDHLVDGSKEARAAQTVRHPHVLVTGTPFVDVWAAVRPAVAGIDAWPDVPKGIPWKAGVLDALGVTASPGEFWRQLLGRVRTYVDLDPTLVGAVERLIDFVTEGDEPLE
ncbi:MAG: DUF3097 domain-containing protein [Actinomycetota bacterium]|nr:DUF3097 domain-containing protein [Actinomycetota bacterium]